MSKLSSILSLGSMARIAGGIVAGGLAAVSYQHYVNSPVPEELPIAKKEEQKKKLEFTVEQFEKAAKELEEARSELESLKRRLANQTEALNSTRSAMEQMQATVAVAAGSPAIDAVEKPMEAIGEPPKSEPVPSPAEHAPKHPAVFDGGNKAPVATANDARKPSVAFGSSGDVVTIEKGGSSDGEAERLRKEIEDLKRQLAEKDGSNLKAYEERLRVLDERLRAERKALAAKKLDSDGEDVFAESDAFGSDLRDGKKKVLRKSNGLPGLSVPNPSGKAATSKAAVDPLAGMTKDEIKECAEGEVQEILGKIEEDPCLFEKITGTKLAGTDEKSKALAEKKLDALKRDMQGALGSQSNEVAGWSLKRVLEENSRFGSGEAERKVEVLREHIDFAKDIKTLGALNAVASVISGTYEVKTISPGKYAELLQKSAEEVAENLKNPPEEPRDEKSEKKKKKIKEMYEKTLSSIFDRRGRCIADMGEMLSEEELPSPGKALENLGAGADKNAILGSLYESDGSGLLKGYKALVKQWGELYEYSLTLNKAEGDGEEGDGVPLPPSPPPPVPGVLLSVDGVPLPPPPPPPVPGVLLPVDEVPVACSADEGGVYEKDYLAVEASLTSENDGLSIGIDIDGLKESNPAVKQRDDRNTAAHKTAIEAFREAGRNLKNAIETLKTAGEDERARVAKLKEDLEGVLKTRREELEKAGKTWREYRRLITGQKHWLEWELSSTGLGDNYQSTVDLAVYNADNQLKADAKRLPAWRLKEAGLLGYKPESDDDTPASTPALTKERKKKLQKLSSLNKAFEAASKALKKRYNDLHAFCDSLGNIKVESVSGDRYRVTLGDGAVLGGEIVYKSLSALAPKIEELTIQKLAVQDPERVLLNFVKLCGRLCALKKLSVTGCFVGDPLKKSEKGFFTGCDNTKFKKLSEGLNLKSFSRNYEGLFFDAVALIPNLRTFEMYNIGSDGSGCDNVSPLTAWKSILAAVESCERVRLPLLGVEAMMSLFEHLLCATEPMPKKTFVLCVSTFGVLLRQEGVPEMLFRLLKSGKATVEWYGDFGVGNVRVYKRADRCYGTSLIAYLRPDADGEINRRIRDLRIDGKTLKQWVSDDFGKNFLARPEVYLKLAGVHSEVFKRMLVRYNEEELNPLYAACYALETLKAGVSSGRKKESFPVNNPLVSILRRCPRLQDSEVVFDIPDRIPIDGSAFRNLILPALLNMLLREYIDGKNHIILSVEKGMLKEEEVQDPEDEEKTKKKPVKGKFTHRYSYYFPSFDNELWKGGAFAVPVDSEVFKGFEESEKDDLKAGVLDAVDALASDLESRADYKFVSFNLDPSVGKTCLRTVCKENVPFYWSWLISGEWTGKLKVGTNAPVGKRKLFEIFSEVAKAQPTYEALFEEHAKALVEHEKLPGLMDKADKLKGEEVPDSEKERERKAKQLSDLEKKIQKSKEEFEEHSTAMKKCADDLSELGRFLDANLPYLKEVSGHLGVKNPKKSLKPKESVAATVPDNKEISRTPKARRADPFSRKNDPDVISAWESNGCPVKYKIAGKTKLSDTPISGYRVYMLAAGIETPKGQEVDRDSVLRAVKAGVLKVEQDGSGGYYVIVTCTL